ITATQMLESMVHAPSPTRAEASDVANAVFDGSSAVMLSGESAVGINPVNAVSVMAEITARADEEFNHDHWASEIREMRDDDATNEPSVLGTDALTEAAREVAKLVDARAIVCVTRSGFTVRKVTRFRPDIPILAFSPDDRVVRHLSLSWGTRPLLTPNRASSAEAVDDALRLSKEKLGLSAGDQVVVISGQSTRSHQTDTLQLMRIP
ncbi:MAG: pyruvate kinase, partial [Actinomycetia bacterium]|nr:pyruvate kinase [Actinomycetes bacterium]